MAKTTQHGKRLPAKTADVQVVRTEEEEELELSVTQAKELRTKIKKLHLGMNMGCVELGRLLSLVHNGKIGKTKGERLYNNWGFSSFKDYCEKELGMSRSKGYDLIDLYRQSKAGYVTSKQVESIGWAKIAKLIPLIKDGIITRQNINKWLKAIEDKNFEEVRHTAQLAQIKAKEKRERAEEQKEIEEEEEEEEKTPKKKKTKKKKKEEEQIAPEEIYTEHISLYKDQYETEQLALQKAKNITGSDKRPWLFDCIFTSFLSEGFSTKEDALEAMCQRIERVFSVRIIALHDKTKEVVFGDRIVKLLRLREKKQEK